MEASISQSILSLLLFPSLIYRAPPRAEHQGEVIRGRSLVMSEHNAVLSLGAFVIGRGLLITFSIPVSLPKKN